MMAEAKAIGQLVRSGWKPKRTLVYLSWDGEEPMLLGSTEWAETHAAELKEKALVYVNTDGAGGGVELPFGGFKKSGYGREKGYEALDTFTATKTVVVRL